MSSLSTASLSRCFSWMFWMSKSTAKQGIPFWSRDSCTDFTWSFVTSCTIFFKESFQIHSAPRVSQKSLWRAADAWSQNISLFSGTPPAISYHSGHGGSWRPQALAFGEVRLWQNYSDPGQMRRQCHQVWTVQPRIPSHRLRRSPICDLCTASHPAWQFPLFGSHHTQFHPKGSLLGSILQGTLPQPTWPGKKTTLSFCPRSTALFTRSNHFWNQAQPQLARFPFCSQSCWAFALSLSVAFPKTMWLFIASALFLLSDFSSSVHMCFTSWRYPRSL